MLSLQRLFRERVETHKMIRIQEHPSLQSESHEYSLLSNITNRKLYDPHSPHFPENREQDYLFSWKQMHFQPQKVEQSSTKSDWFNDDFFNSIFCQQTMKLDSSYRFDMYYRCILFLLLVRNSLYPIHYCLPCFLCSFHNN